MKSLLIKCAFAMVLGIVIGATAAYFIDKDDALDCAS